MKRIVDLLQEIRPEFDFAESTDFVGDGYLDSFDITTLVSELETIYGCNIDGMDILPENFATVNDIAQLVLKSGGNVEIVQG